MNHTESPGPPSDLRVSNVTNTSAVLSWSPPNDNGGRPLYEIVYTITAMGEYRDALTTKLISTGT